MARVNAREAALKTATDGMRWILAGTSVSDDDRANDIAQLETAVELAAIHRAQRGLLNDLDAVADAIYGRQTTGAQPQ
jgi:hypothetical protein